MSVCTRLHFGRELEGEKEKYIRLAYSAIDTPEIKEGLAKLKALTRNNARARTVIYKPKSLLWQHTRLAEEEMQEKNDR